MPIDEASGYCGYCQRHVLGRRPSVNHVLHAIVSIFSCGFWVLIWILLGITNASAQFACPTCGGALDMKRAK